LESAITQDLWNACAYELSSNVKNQPFQINDQRTLQIPSHLEIVRCEIEHR
jgi:hypothetical protein